MGREGMSSTGREPAARASLGPGAQEQRREHPAWFSEGEFLVAVTSPVVSLLAGAGLVNPCLF